MPKAIWNETVLAESDQTRIVEGNHYFPPETLRKENFRESDATTVCGWKGTANYYDLVVGDDLNEQAAWYYADPKAAAAEIEKTQGLIALIEQALQAAGRDE